MRQMISRYCKKDIGMFGKIVAPLFLIFAIVFVVLGVAMIIDGVVSQMSGGYGDNIVLGVMVLLFFPVLSIVTFKAVSMTNDEWLRL